MIAKKNASDEQWKTQRQAERDKYEVYLEQWIGSGGMNQRVAIALAMLQKPEVTQFGTREKWKTLGRSVKDAEVKNSFQIFSRASFGKGYILAPAYDVSQTYGREVRAISLADGSPEMEKALSTVLNYAVVPVVLDQGLEGGPAGQKAPDCTLFFFALQRRADGGQQLAFAGERPHDHEPQHPPGEQRQQREGCQAEESFQH